LLRSDTILLAADEARCRRVFARVSIHARPGRKTIADRQERCMLHYEFCIDSRVTGRSIATEPAGQTGDLTDEQRAFVQVVGQALAETWRRLWRQLTDNEAMSLPQDTGSKLRIHYHSVGFPRVGMGGIHKLAKNRARRGRR